MKTIGQSPVLLKFLKLALCTFLFNSYGHGQCFIASGASAPDVTLQCSGGTVNRSGLAFNPAQNLYYSVNAGTATYPIETFAVTGGNSIASMNVGADYRGYWWNSTTGQPEGNTVASNGIYSNALNGSFHATSTVSLVGTGGQPAVQACGAGDIANNQVIYYDGNGKIYKYNRSTGAFSSSVSISGLPVATSNLNSTSIVFTGISGKEAGIYDYVNKCVYLINYTSGAYVSTYTLPASAPANFSYRFSFCNSHVFLYDSSTSQWLGYPTGVTSVATQTNVSCFGFSNGVAHVAPNNGTGPYTYAWAPSGGTGSTASNLSAGSYTATVTDNNGCDGKTVFNITAPSALATSTSASNALCNGNSGSATLSTSGGTAPYSYTWSTGATGSFVSIPAGVYSATITDANSCSNLASVTISEPPALVTATAAINALCFGTPGSASITAIGGTAPYTYTWSNGVAVHYSVFLPGTYTATVTDANNCSSSKTVVVGQPPQLISSTTVTNALCNGLNGAANLSAVGGTGAYTYSWSSGATTAAASLPAGIYTATITDANNCSSSTTVSITQPFPLVASTTESHAPCAFHYGSASVTASGGTGPYTYTWSNGVATSYSLFLAGFYTVTVTDANNCSASNTLTIYQPPGLMTSTLVSNVLCNGGYGSAQLINLSGGSGAYSVSWSSGASGLIASLPAGVHTATLSDANNCILVSTVTVTQPPALVTTTAVMNAPCFGSYGSATISASGGVGGYTYTWSHGLALSYSMMPAGTYTASVKDANNCVSTKTVIVGQPQAIVTATNLVSPSCFGGNGSMTLTPSGGTAPYTYSWSTSSATTSVASIPAGISYWSVIDANNCIDFHGVYVPQPAAIVTNTAVINALCFGANGSATVTTSGGTGVHTYSWSSSATSPTVSLPAGNHQVAVKDANNCSVTISVTISEPSLLTATVNSSAILCNGGTAGASITPSGGTGSYMYNWNGSSGGSIVTLGVGQHTITVTDVNGCSLTKTLSLTAPPAMTLNISSTPVLCQGGASTVNVTASGGTPSYTGTGSFTVLAGIGTVTVSDANACTAFSSYTISQPQLLTHSLSITPILCHGGTATVIVSGSGGTPPYTGTGSSTMTAGTGSVTISDANGCAVSNTFQVTQPAAMSTTHSHTLCSGDKFTFGQQDFTSTGSYTFMFSAVNTCDSLVTLDLFFQNPVNVITGQNGALMTASASGASYQWVNCDNNHAVLPGETGQTFSASTDGNYAVIVTEHGCTDTSACMNFNTVGIARYSMGNELSIYPNPGTGLFHLSMSQAAEFIEVSDLMGGQILALKPETLNTLLDLSQQTNGIYFVTVRGVNSRSSIRIILNR